MRGSSIKLIYAGALLGVTGVLLGAFGAHGLNASESQADSWAVAVQYQLIHSLLLLIVALWHHFFSIKALRIAGLAFVVGILLFSGSIYMLVLGGPSVLGPITPMGGVALVLGWLCLGVAGYQSRKGSNAK